MKVFKIKIILLLLIIFSLLISCDKEKKNYDSKDNNVRSQQTAKYTELDVSFADPAWNGKIIPEGQQCVCDGAKNPMTPSFNIKNIPPETNVIVMEYSDRSYAPMDNGGHGKIGFKIKQGTQSVMIPSVPGHSFELPDGFFIITPHQGSFWCKAGAYQPSCSGGRK